jgi:hypothetical protein
MDSIMKVESYEDFLDFIKNWKSWVGDHQYDFNGMVGILGACLDNLRDHCVEVELEEIVDCLEPQQVEFIRKILGISYL